MSYSPGYADVVPPMVGPFCLGWSGYAQERVLSSAPASATWEAANRAAYFPVLVPTTCVVRRVWWANGVTVNASYNLDCGIYADAGYKPGAKLVSTGSTAQGTASQVQFVDVTDTTLAPGRYWIALACSSTSATVMSVNVLASVVSISASIRFQQESALALPASATPVESSASGVHLCGFATTASP